MIKCEKCLEMFDVEENPGGLLFTPPTTLLSSSQVKKIHLCSKCVYIIIAGFKKEEILFG